MSGIAALKGYRTQFLYSLYKLLSEKDNNKKYRLEGIEDIDILDEEDLLVEVVQVKNLNSTLTLSDIVSKKNTSFLKRFLDVRQSNTNTKAKLVCFGSISADLTKWLSEKNTITKSEIKSIQTFGLNEKEWLFIKQNLSIQTIVEETIYSEITSILKETFQFVDPIPTIKMLLYWLSFNAEKQIVVSITTLLSEIQNIGQYLSERISLTNQFGIYISPIGVSGGQSNLEYLKEEFYSGISARYEHIIYGLDVLREDAMYEIANGYLDTNVVIIQGASGQGKSTLSYRYIKDSCPETMCYEINLQEDVVNTREAIQSINAFAKELNSPALFLINVNSNSVEWIKLVREFSNEKYIRFLVTIRQEDWYKATAHGIEFRHSEIELSLDKREAESIYQKLNEQKTDFKNTDFEEAWIKIGENSPLLEFVYSITQGQSLSNKLRQQVSQIETEQSPLLWETLNLLRIVTLADSFGAKINAANFADIAGILSITQRLEKEYLIKIDNQGKYFSGLHQLRSKLLLEHLFDEVIYCRKDYIIKCFDFISPDDVFSFLTQILETNLLSAEVIIENANKLPRRWSTYFYLLQSLIWKGVCDYVDENRHTIQEAYAAYGDAWYLFLDVYFGNTLDAEQLLRSLNFGEDIIQKSIAISARLTNKEDVFHFAQNLFKTLPLPEYSPQSNPDFRGFGGVHFWLKHIPNEVQITDKLQVDNNILQHADAKALAEALLGISQFKEIFAHSIDELEKTFIEKLQIELSIPYIDTSSEIIQATYIVNPLGENEKYSLNRSTVTIIDLLRKAFPDKAKYNVKAFGQNLALLPTENDESYKSIEISNLPLDYWVNLNALVRRRFEYNISPKNWLEYFFEIDQWEENMFNVISKLNPIFKKSLGTHSSSDYELIAANIDYKNLKELKKPQPLLDPFGLYGGDRNSSYSLSEEEEKSKTIKFHTKFDNFFKAKSKFQNSLENFIRQSGTYFYDIVKKRKDSQHTINDNNLHISQTNLFEAIKSITDYKYQRKKQFQKFSTVQSKLNQSSLIETAFLYKKLINGNNIVAGSINSSTYLIKLKMDFESRLVSACKKHSHKEYFELKYLNDNSTNKQPIIQIKSKEPIFTQLGIRGAFEAVKEAVNNVEYTSLKQLMLNLLFEYFYFLPIVLGNTLNNAWYTIPEYAFRDDFENVSAYTLFAKQIDEEVKLRLGLLDWNNLAPKTSDAFKFLTRFIKAQALVQHIADLGNFEQYTINDTGQNIFNKHLMQFQEEIQSEFQFCIDYLADVGKELSDESEIDETDELEVEFWDAYFGINRNIFPREKGDEFEYKTLLELDDLKIWGERLKLCTEHLSVFYFLLCGKLIRERMQSQSV